jgi:hypothetical protein
MPLTPKGFSPIWGQLSFPARKTAGAEAQVAFDLGGTLVACVQQPECLSFEFRCVRPSRLFHPSPSESGIIHDLVGLSSCPLFRGKVKYHYTGLLTVENIQQKDIEKLEKWQDDLWMFTKGFNAFYVIDGQQRLTTTIILLKVIFDRFSDEES